jgi:hypothetical protein
MPATSHGIFQVALAEADIVERCIVEGADLAKSPADLDLAPECGEKAPDVRGLGGRLLRGPIAGGGMSCHGCLLTFDEEMMRLPLA